MYKRVSFNVFELNLENIVYKNKKVEPPQRFNKEETSKTGIDGDMPIPKPIEEFWKKPLEDRNDN